MLSREAPSRVLLTTDAVGGVWRYCLELAQGIVRYGASVVLVTMGPPPADDQRSEARSLGVDLVETALPLDWLARDAAELEAAANELARLVRRVGADIVQLHTPALACADWPVPVVAVAHSCVGTWWRAVHGDAPMPPDLAWRAGCVARGLAAAGAVIAPSAGFAGALHDAYGVNGILAIPNGRRTVPLARDPQAQALTAGRLWDAGKNVMMLDTAASELGFPVRAAGPTHGPNGAHIAPRHLHLLGVMDEAALAREYASAAVFVSTARYEPFGLAALEAAQSGLALVLSDIPTLRQLWDGAAIFVQPDDPVALARSLRRLLQDPTRCAGLGETARTHAQRYTAERMVAATWSVLCNLWREREDARARHAA